MRLLKIEEVTYHLNVLKMQVFGKIKTLEHIPLSYERFDI